MKQTKDDVLESVLLRTRRARSWIEAARAEVDKHDFHSAFVMYWIAFNACYEEYLVNKMKLRMDRDSEQKQFKKYLEKVVDHDSERSIIEILIGIGEQLYGLVENHFSFHLFWEFGHLPRAENNDWEGRFESECKDFEQN